VGFGHDLGALSGADLPFMSSFDKAQSLIEKRFLHPGFTLRKILGHKVLFFFSSVEIFFSGKGNLLITMSD
jgi:hypothetical protein